MHTIVRCLSLASFLSIWIILNEVELSRPLVGSSQRRRLGSVISSYPMLDRFLSPPDIPFFSYPPTLVCLHSWSPSLLTISSILSSISSRFKDVLSLAANRNYSSGVKVSSNTSSCWTNAPNFPKSPFLRMRSFTLISPVVIDPLLSPSLCPIILSKDVLPLPLAPIIAIICPGFANPEIPCRICFLGLPLSLVEGSVLSSVAS